VAGVYTKKKPFDFPPYDQMDVREIETFIMENNRLPIPSSVPSDISQMIEECWDQEPSKRPDFAGICEKLNKLLDRVDGGLKTSRDDIKKDREEYPQLPPFFPSKVTVSPPSHNHTENHTVGKTLSSPTLSSPTLCSPTVSGPTLQSFASERNLTIRRNGSISTEVPKLTGEIPEGYVGEMDRLVAEEKLGRNPGTYLIRYSKDAYVISYVSTDIKYVHIRAAITSNGLKVDNTSGKSEEFENLHTLASTMIKRKYITSPVAAW